jgi:hypothetical protein
VTNGEVTVLLCFLRGTHIATPRGEVPVEGLTIGGEMNTYHSGQATMRWVGYRHVDCRRRSKPELFRPFASPRERSVIISRPVTCGCHRIMPFALKAF